MWRWTELAYHDNILGSKWLCEICPVAIASDIHTSTDDLVRREELVTLVFSLACVSNISLPCSRVKKNVEDVGPRLQRIEDD